MKKYILCVPAAAMLLTGCWGSRYISADPSLEDIYAGKDAEGFLLVGILGKMCHDKVLEVFHGLFDAGVILLIRTDGELAGGAAYVGKDLCLFVVEVLDEFIPEIGEELPDNLLMGIFAGEHHSADACGKVTEGHIYIVLVGTREIRDNVGKICFLKLLTAWTVV